MPTEYVLTMTAANRAGILSAVTKALSELDADLRELSQTVVRGYFTMIFSAEFPDNLDATVIRAHVEDTCRPFDIAVGLKCPAADDVPHVADDSAAIHAFRIGGKNHPGALKEISTAISVQRTDIVGMRAVRTSGSEGFEMVMKVAVPRDVPVEQLVAAISASASDCEITVDLTNAH